jgi:transcriptional regulator with XRE-family HTH domain
MSDAQLTGRQIIRRRVAPELALIDRGFLTACIAERDLSQRQVALLVGCSAEFISKLCRGDAKGCKTYTAQAIAKALGRRTEELFTAGVAPKQRPRRPSAAA